MKKSYNFSAPLLCISCGDSDFDYNEDKSWIKCNRCLREYNGGYDELVELNQGSIGEELEKKKAEIGEDLKNDISDMIKKTFKGNKNIKFK